MKIIFFGTPEFAAPCINKLYLHPDFELVGVVTQPDTRRGRGNSFSPAPVKALVLSLNSKIPIWQPERLKKDSQVLSALSESGADLFVVVAYGQILSQSILDLPKFGCINVHGSLLPKYRGAAPIQWAIANGEKITGVTTMQMDAGIDTGAMLLKASLEITPEDQAESLSQKLAVLGADLLIETLENLANISPISQDHSLTCYSPMISKTDQQLDWSMPAQKISDRIRGFYPNSFSYFRNQRIKVTKAELFEQNNSESNAVSMESNQPELDEIKLGAIAAVVKNIGFVVQTGEGQLLIKEVQPSDKKLQTSWDFANGARLKIGEVLGIEP
jgi:methionyl-tRNA formyltransferase